MIAPFRLLIRPGRRSFSLTVPTLCRTLSSASILTPMFNRLAPGDQEKFTLTESPVFLMISFVTLNFNMIGEYMNLQNDNEVIDGRKTSV